MISTGVSRRELGEGTGRDVDDPPQVGLCLTLERDDTHSRTRVDFVHAGDSLNPFPSPGLS